MKYKSFKLKCQTLMQLTVNSDIVNLRFDHENFTRIDIRRHNIATITTKRQLSKKR